jgi:hypothetical protein
VAGLQGGILSRGGRIYDFVTPIELLKFSPLGLADRVRLGLVSLYLRRYKNWPAMEGVTAREWLTRYGGRDLYILANTTQIYPEDRGMNYGVKLGRKVAGLVSAEC